MSFKYIFGCARKYNVSHCSKLQKPVINLVAGSSCRTITSTVYFQNLKYVESRNRHHRQTFPAFFHTAIHPMQSNSTPNQDKLAQLSSQMNMRLLNENSFLSWCRNAYLSSVVGIAMMDQATSIMAQSAGFAAFMIGGMNVFWGTSCHVINLFRLRQASGMSGLVLSLNICGSLFHCLLWLCILTCYIGFLDEDDKLKKANADDVQI